ncbi:hypothetical protein [Roseovarius sp. MBR-6]|jgi:hypothetical protein|uniref:hypothetical protein n=1 Tax=Roseovarius sp. MBR-6 TaxID=3156459 RepID=UPI003397C80A
MKHYNGADNTKKLIETYSTAARPTLSIDIDRYQAYLDGAELTPEQKDAFLRAMWSIVVTFVELGYGVHPLQEACGKVYETDARPPAQAADAVLSEDNDTAKPLEKPDPPGTPEV